MKFGKSQRCVCVCVCVRVCVLYSSRLRALQQQIACFIAAETAQMRLPTPCPRHQQVVC